MSTILFYSRTVQAPRTYNPPHRIYPHQNRSVSGIKSTTGLIPADDFSTDPKNVGLFDERVTSAKTIQPLKFPLLLYLE